MMPDNLYFRLCVMQAFQAVITNGQAIESSDAAEKIISLAKHMKDFCDLHVPQSFLAPTISLVDDKGLAEIDAAIEMHIKELREKETTILPKNRETLLQFYDRLQQRKSRRMQLVFYAKATTEKLADLVLRYLDEEIEDAAEGAHA